MPRVDLLKGCPSYKRSLQPSKENILHFKKLKLLTFFYFCGSFRPPGSPDPESVSRDPTESGSTTLPR
jgi:hypothetical protein